jgi:soluble lytic murein transglycosylase-like protein
LKSSVFLNLTLSLGLAANYGSMAIAQSVLESRLSPSLGLESGAQLTSSEDLGLSLTDRQVNALLEEGARFEHGEGISKDPASAQRAYCAAIDLGSSDAMIRLGWMYANGRGVARDDAIAFGLFDRAAKAGNAMGERLSAMVRASAAKASPCATRSQNGPLVAGAAQRNEGNVTSSAQPKPSVTLGVPAEFRKPMSSLEQKKLTANILKMSTQFRLDPRLVLAVIQQESSFDPNARSPKNAQGLMQLIPETAERFAVKDPFDPLENVRGGMAYLRWLLAYFKGDVSLVLAGYNAGEGAVDKHKGIPPFGETLAYVQRIRALYPFDRHPFDAKASAGRVTSVR